MTLPPAPIAAVAETSPLGVLPMIADDGRQPWQVYARPFTRGSQPVIAVIVATLGADRELMNSAIETLPDEVTLAFDARLAARDDGLARARAAGHETMLVIPTEPQDYPVSDPGPDTLLVGLPAEKNQQRLLSLLRQSSGYVGMMTLSGTRFVTMPKAMNLLLEESKQRGLAMLDTRLSPRADIVTPARAMKVPVAAVDLRIPAESSAAMIDAMLAQTTATARKTGQAVCLVMATPLALDRLHHWQDTLAKAGIRLAPLSALLQ
jgi:uncharacterized protein